jgi:hypothetical protein
MSGPKPNTDRVDELLAKLYYGSSDPGSAGAFSSAMPLYYTARKFLPSVTLGQVKKFLSRSHVHLMHYRKQPKRFKHRPFVALSKGYYGCDLLVEKTSRMPYLLICAEYLTGLIRAVPLPNKRADSVVRGWKVLFPPDQPRQTPVSVSTDLVLSLRFL